MSNLNMPKFNSAPPLLANIELAPDLTLENLNSLFAQDILKIEIGSQIKTSFVNVKNGHAHKFAVEKSPSGRLIIRIDDNEKMTDSVNKEHIIGSLIYSPKMDQWTGLITSQIKIDKDKATILKNIITGTANNPSWVNSKNLTREQIQNLPKRITKKT